MVDFNLGDRITSVLRKERVEGGAKIELENFRSKIDTMLPDDAF